MTLKRRFLIALIFLLCMQFKSYAQEAENSIADSPPPYMANSSNFALVLFNLDVEKVKSILPRDIHPNINDSGMVTAGLEMYTTERVFGLPNFTMAFIFVEVEGMDSENGTPGHWAIWGNSNNKKVLHRFETYYNFPYVYQEHLDIALTEKEFSGEIGSEGNPTIALKIALQNDQPVVTEGIVNMCAKRKDNSTIASEVVWFTNGYVGKPVSFQIRSKGVSTLEILKGVQPYWALVSNRQQFCYSKPLFLE